MISLKNLLAKMLQSIKKIGKFNCVNFTLTYVENESMLSLVQRAYAHSSMPKGEPFIAVVSSGAYYTMQGYWYESSSYGYCILSTINNAFKINLSNGDWSIRGMSRNEDTAAGYLTTAKSLTTSRAIIPLGENSLLRGNFTKSSDGGYKALRAGTYRVSAFAHVTSANADDTIAFNISRYNGGWVYDTSSVYAVGKTDRSASIPAMVLAVNENDYIYLRGRNVTAARGSVDSARMLIEALY